jgi:hypothetical protein
MVGSLGYADRLKRRKNLGGQLGAAEFHESVDAAQAKAKELADLVGHQSSAMPATLCCAWSVCCAQTTALNPCYDRLPQVKRCLCSLVLASAPALAFQTSGA